METGNYHAFMATTVDQTVWGLWQRLWMEARDSYDLQVYIRIMAFTTGWEVIFQAERCITCITILISFNIEASNAAGHS
jgi:hypothetical protein